jgi:mannose-6-phosphate isomerase-like protein (cupin superfamily)
MDDDRGQLVEVIREGCWRQLNRMTIKRGEARGEHYHKRLVESFHVIEGSVRFDVRQVQTGATQQFVLEHGECVIIEPFDYHVLTALEDTTLVSLYSERFDPHDLFDE